MRLGTGVSRAGRPPWEGKRKYACSPGSLFFALLRFGPISRAVGGKISENWVSGLHSKAWVASSRMGPGGTIHRPGFPLAWIAWENSLAATMEYAEPPKELKQRGWSTSFELQTRANLMAPIMPLGKAASSGIGTLRSLEYACKAATTSSCGSDLPT